MVSSDSWCSISSEVDEIYDEEKKEINRTDINTVRIDLFGKLLSVLKQAIEPLEYKPIEMNKFLEFKRLEKDESDNVLLFRKLIFQGIPCKLYLIINNPIEFVIETFLPEIIEKFHLKRAGLVCYIGSDGSLINTTILHSTRFKHFGVFNALISEMKEPVFDLPLFKKFRERLAVSLPKDFDERFLFSKIPKSLRNLKYHPFYTAELILRRDQIIHPMRPVLGFFKGEPVFYKKNVQTLRSERGWFKLGKKITKDKFKMIKGVKFYRKYEVEDIVIEDLDGKSMSFFHENHIPRNCIYSKDEMASFVARILDLRFSECVVGFKYKIPVIQGIFLERKNESVFFMALEEFKFNKSLIEQIEKGEKVFSFWDNIIRKINRFQKLKALFD